MRQVTPEVFGPISQPSINWDELERYLKEVGADDYFDRISQSDGSHGDILTEVGGRLCYRSWQPGLNANVSKVREDSGEYIGNILRSGHGSVVEHPNYTFIFHNISRVFSHELCRHRAGVAISQESLRFVRLTDLPIWQPDWALGDDALQERVLRWLRDTEQLQVWMADHFGLDDEGVPFSEKKHKTSYMRRWSPQGVATGLMATINVRALRHIIYMRTAIPAEEEIRLVCDQLAEKALEAVPLLMQDFDPNQDREWIPLWIKI